VVSTPRSRATLRVSGDARAPPNALFASDCAPDEPTNADELDAARCNTGRRLRLWTVARARIRRVASPVASEGADHRACGWQRFGEPGFGSEAGLRSRPAPSPGSMVHSTISRHGRPDLGHELRDRARRGGRDLAVALSVAISTSAALETTSPSFTSHFVMVPSTTRFAELRRMTSNRHDDVRACTPPCFAQRATGDGC